VEGRTAGKWSSRCVHQIGSQCHLVVFKTGFRDVYEVKLGFISRAGLIDGCSELVAIFPARSKSATRRQRHFSSPPFLFV
jgi:hypothetical protein